MCDWVGEEDRGEEGFGSHGVIGIEPANIRDYVARMAQSLKSDRLQLNPIRRHTRTGGGLFFYALIQFSVLHPHAFRLQLSSPTARTPLASDSARNKYPDAAKPFSLGIAVAKCSVVPASGFAAVNKPQLCC